MLVWLASYPKSGNTLVRAMLASYFFSQDGKFNFELLPNIKQFPSNQFLKNLNIDTNNDDEVLKNYINAQSKFNKKKAIQFVKTHCGFNKVNGYSFTNFDITLGAIYIIRDPRNLVESFSRHYSFSIDQSVDFLIKGLILPRNEKRPLTVVGSWRENFESWKSLEQSSRFLLVKYEDIVSNKKLTLKKILSFIKKLSGSNFLIDEGKIQNVCDSTSFENMKKMEENDGFIEAQIDEKTNKKIKFFELGPDVDRKDLVKSKNINKIEKHYKKELKYFGYI